MKCTTEQTSSLSHWTVVSFDSHTVELVDAERALSDVLVDRRLRPFGNVCRSKNTREPACSFVLLRTAHAPLESADVTKCLTRVETSNGEGEK